MAKLDTMTLAGTAHWAMVLGAPVKGYDEVTLEWSFDLTPDDYDAVEAAGLTERLKTNKHEEQGKFLKFRRLAFKRADNSPNKPIRVVDENGDAWDNDKLLGNGTRVEVEFTTFPIPPKKGKPASIGFNPMEIRVLEYKEYVRTEKTPAAPRDGNEASKAEQWT